MPGSEELRGKKSEKAKIYEFQPERFTVLSICLEMESEHGLRHVRFEDKRWSCTCEAYKALDTCSHIMASVELLKPLSAEAGSDRGDATASAG